MHIVVIVACMVSVCINAEDRSFSRAFLRAVHAARPSMAVYRTTMKHRGFRTVMWHHHDALVPELDAFALPNDEPVTSPMYDRLSLALDVGIGVYAGYRLYSCYYAPPSQDMAYTLLTSVMPSSIQSFGRCGYLVTCAAAVALEAYLYRAVGKLVLVCTVGDLGDAVEQCVRRCRRVIGSALCG